MVPIAGDLAGSTSGPEAVSVEPRGAETRDGKRKRATSFGAT